MTLIKYLSTIYDDQLTDTDKMILKNINKNIEYVPELTISELSKKTYTSSSSLHRLVKKIGFNGYSEFKYTVVNELHNHSKEKFNFSKMNNYLINISNDIKITHKLNEDKLEEVVKAIMSHDNIYCFGTGWKQKQIVDNFAHDLLNYGHVVKTLRNTDDLEILSKQLNKSSLIIIVSLSGNLKNYRKALEYIDKKGVNIVGVSIYSDNPLSNIVTHSLQYVDSSLEINNHHWSAATLNFIFDQLSHSLFAYNKE